jgi:N-acetylglucosamine-6-phosphate deacetylase
MAFALCGARVFDGQAFHAGKAVVVEGKAVAALTEEARLPPGMKRVVLEGGILAPGFVDVQVNGGGGALLNASPTVETVQQIAESHRRFGTVGLLPTVITDAPAITAAAIAAVRQARGSVPGVLGIHVEGPFLDLARKGAHDPHFIRLPDNDDVAMLAHAKCGVVMLTLAPNKVPPETVRKLVNAGVLVSLGHADASYAHVRAALAAGASAFTHLYNAMSQLSGREPGMVGSALSDSQSFIGFIADGYHVHDAALKLAFAATSPGRFMMVSDAMPPAAGGPSSFELQGRVVRREGDRLQLDDGTLAGSNITMLDALRYCVSKLGLPLEQALRMSSTNPARFLGLSKEHGVIATGARASLVHLGDDLTLKKTWIDGQ